MDPAAQAQLMAEMWWKSQLSEWERRRGAAFAATDQHFRVSQELQGARTLKIQKKKL